LGGRNLLWRQGCIKAVDIGPPVDLHFVKIFVCRLSRHTNLTSASTTNVRHAVDCTRVYERGSAGTLFRDPTATEGPKTEGNFECLLLTKSEYCSEIKCS